MEVEVIFLMRFLDEIPATPKSAEAVVEIENVLNMRSDSST